MPAQLDPSKLSVRQFAERFRGEMIPLSSSISYYCASTPLSEEDLKEYLEEPVAALPPAISAALPKISILLVPYLERGHHHVKKADAKKADAAKTEHGSFKKDAGKKDAPHAGPNEAEADAGEKAENAGSDYVSIERPPTGRQSASTHLKIGDETVLAFALKEQEVAEYHYRFYHLLASLMGERFGAAHKNDHDKSDVEERYCHLLREELTADVHGEVDEPSWRLKQGLKRTRGVREGKAFREYARQSFTDTLTLYLHGICCDIDVETGPRQVPSRYLRKRLILLEELFQPPKGYAVFPEQLEQLEP